MDQNAKLVRDIDFDATKFNLDFEMKDTLLERLRIEEQRKVLEQRLKEEKAEQERLQKLNYREDIIIEIKEMFFFILEKLSNGENPFIEIFSDEKKLFIFSILSISFGGLLLFLSNLMTNKTN